MTGTSVIQLFESRSAHFTACSERERMAAERVRNSEARNIHIQLAEMFEREALLFPRLSAHCKGE